MLSLPPASKMVSCLLFYLYMEVICSPKTLVDFQRTTKHYIPKNRTLHNHCGEILKSYTEDLGILW
jgi:hypothetical protein